jgi:hypothetical protein
MDPGLRRDDIEFGVGYEGQQKGAALVDCALYRH